MMRSLAIVCSSMLLWIHVFSQDNFDTIHQEDFARWSQVTRLSPSDIHRMWRSTSHYANESDDDSSIELIDAKSLAWRNQTLMIVSAGIPRCVTVAVFSVAPVPQKLWQENQGPDSYGFCDNLGIVVDVTVTKDGMILIATAVHPDENDGSRAVIRTYSYKWDGKTYVWLATRDSLKAKPSRRTGLTRGQIASAG
jgi:hypothetical protein